MDKIHNIFKKIKIEPKVMGIGTMFNNQRRLDKTNYKPSYQRNYVWDNEKSTYFIESIILGTEIPPLIFFKTKDSIEVIDGRQRYETIYNFVKQDSKQKLSQTGLLIFEDLKNKKFSDLDIEIRNSFWDTKLRFIEFGFINEDEDFEIEEVVKREIFKRYNTGITPLKSSEIDNAKYLYTDLNSHFKDMILKDRRARDMISDLFYYENSNIEILLKEIRKILVLDSIPISYYSIQKDKVLNRFFEYNFQENEIDCNLIYSDFIRKVNFLQIINAHFKQRKVVANRLVFECLYWAMSIIEKSFPDKNIIKELSVSKIFNSLMNYLIENIDAYKAERNSFSAEMIYRYTITSIFFEKLYKIDFTPFIKNNQEFKDKQKNIEGNKSKTDKSTLEKFESLRLNKPDATSITIDDITQQMDNNRFLIRPPYQRDEVINQVKSSAIIESILLGIKLPPIFVFKRLDGVSEVIDGQQRLLSIIAFLGRNYVDEKGNRITSKKNNYSLNLKNSILQEYNRKKFSNLPKYEQDKILDFDLWIIEINEKDNKYFQPIDLFLRLNSKPFPIKENTFEMWNSYIDRSIIDNIKIVSSEHDYWFYLRKNNKRMDNEGLIASFIYLFNKYQESNKDFDDIKSFLELYLSGDKIQTRINPKSNITSLLEKKEKREELIHDIKRFEKNFLSTLRSILNVENYKLNDELNKLLHIDSVRSSHKFYILWLLIVNGDPVSLSRNTDETKKDISEIIQSLNTIGSLSKFEKLVVSFWNKYK
ncbi:hypothetical protein CMU45_00615 [Elizabethkingia anophelis]|nr:hypothetical protein [Elizabethkingia anophelis]